MQYDPDSGHSSDRLPPRNLECEMGVIGAVLLDDDHLDAVVKILPRPDPFFRDNHQILWRSILDLYRDGKPVDVNSLCAELERVGRLKAAGGDEAIAAIVESVPSVANAAYYAAIVKDHADRREMIEVARRMLESGYACQSTVVEMIGEATAKIFEIAEGQTGSRLRSVHEMVPERIEALNRRAETGEVTGLGSGWGDLDALTGGFQAEQLIVVAGRPSMGKSAFGLNVADYVAFDLKAPVLYVSIEMGSAALVDRLIGSRGRIESHKIRTGQGIGRREINALGDLRVAMNFPLLWIDDSPNQSMVQIMASARSMARKGGLAMIIVDYIQLIEPENPRDPRQEQVAKISRRLKQLARELAVPVIILAQLNREVEKRENHRPRMADLKESGAIEQDADIVMLLHRADYYEKDRPYASIVESEVIVDKNRNGATGTVKLGMNLPCMRFEQLNPHAQRYDNNGDEVF